MKIDFLHVGYHRTASSMLQFYGFSTHDDIVMVNDPRTDLDDYFVRNFVETDDFFSNADSFLGTFTQKVEHTFPDRDGKIVGISEENISGHFWNGMGAKILAERVRDVFGNAKIIIVIRNQFDMLASLYGNYIKNSRGIRSLKGLLRDDGMLGHRVFAKLCYHKLIEHYVKLFGPQNVRVLCYEEFSKDIGRALNRIFTFVGARELTIDQRLFATRANPRLSIFGEALMRSLNAYERHGNVLRGFIRKMDGVFRACGVPNNDGQVRKMVTAEQIEDWRRSNRVVQALVSSNLEEFHYPL